MLIYANHFNLGESTATSTVLSAVARWIGQKEKCFITPDTLTRDGRDLLASGGRIEVISSTAGWPKLYSISYSHKDSSVPGRLWTVELGLSEAADVDSEFTILVKTDEVSSRVSLPTSVSRPQIVEIVAIRENLVSESTAGRLMNLLDRHNAGSVARAIENVDRGHSIVVVSPRPDGSYPADPNRLCSLVVGLAEVYAIPPDGESFYVSALLGDRYDAFAGAINVIFPIRKLRQGVPAEYRRILERDIEEVIEEQRTPESEVLSVLTHRSNLPLSWRHISPQKVRDVQVRRRLEGLREKLRSEEGETAFNEEYVGLLEQEAESLRQQLQSETSDKQFFSDQVEVLEDQLKEKDDELRQARQTHQTLVDLLNNAQEAEPQIGGGVDPLDVVRVVTQGDQNPERLLRLIANYAGDRLVVLDSAYDSAKKSTTFRNTKKLAELLIKLVTEYRSQLVAGMSDLDASSTFGADFAPTESETVLNNKEARRYRTFSYNGSEVLMDKHLRLGVKDSAAETIRVHFYWDNENQKVVIGYCGPHLPFK